MAWIETLIPLVEYVKNHLFHVTLLGLFGLMETSMLLTSTNSVEHLLNWRPNSKPFNMFNISANFQEIRVFCTWRHRPKSPIAMMMIGKYFFLLLIQASSLLLLHSLHVCIQSMAIKVNFQFNMPAIKRVINFGAEISLHRINWTW